MMNTVTLLWVTFWWNTGIYHNSIVCPSKNSYNLACLQKKSNQTQPNPPHLLQQCQAFNGVPKQCSLEQKVKNIRFIQDLGQKISNVMEGRQHKRITRNISPLFSTCKASSGLLSIQKNVGLLLQVQWSATEMITGPEHLSGGETENWDCSA